MPKKTNFKIVLVAPEIPGNTGSIGRTCVALNIPLILIKPYGFDLSEKAVRRAGLDYWKFLDLTEYDCIDQFMASEKPAKEQLCFFSKNAEKTYFEANFVQNSFLIFGSETKGLPSELFGSYPERFLSVPMLSDKVRSLNLSNVATAVAYETYRQLSL
ncbi:MAG: tRNA (cytidine(34)-2'-O)-methyltransferase [Halobacteriovoraceae bacterium]|jgi:tRNA (cytidine/uridine-2'-O-)-methyltransferase|nr:tRNA (cytidine(34)-2'-O)-methyltransferase [Halobacteriovoraceae bacterium]MBT5092722.1 tRNA (cytidine(34)-2'-O)-methyltransferase [Halobacteriovoraceae bacterium]